MSLAIKVENISKAYQLGEIGTGTLSQDLERWISRIRGKEDPFLRIGETNDRTTKGSTDIVWSLKDINFEIEQGDTVGIIGRNGAGKSTLLKILSRVTSPTTGRIIGKGRIASLLEVGTGFHPELSGRENIYLNGAILGMRKREIESKFDNIVTFAGIERYIDTPVKRYSSGMYVRLAFAVAAHLESEILIVDEVLAVGDVEFQKKCLGKMQDISKNEGRTVLFVSHNMAAIQNLCKRAILLENGRITVESSVEDVINKYNVKKQNNINNTEKDINGMFCEVITSKNSYLIGENIEISIKIKSPEFINTPNFGIGIQTNSYSRVVTFHTIYHQSDIFKKGDFFKIKLIWKSNFLAQGLYNFVIAVFDGSLMLECFEDIGELNILEHDINNTGRLNNPSVQGYSLPTNFEILNNLK